MPRTRSRRSQRRLDVNVNHMVEKYQSSRTHSSLPNPPNEIFNFNVPDDLDGEEMEDAGFKSTFISIDPANEIHEVEEMDIADSDEDNGEVPIEHSINQQTIDSNHEHMPAFVPTNNNSFYQPPQHLANLRLIDNVYSSQPHPPPWSGKQPRGLSTPYVRETPRQTYSSVYQGAASVSKDPRLAPRNPVQWASTEVEPAPTEKSGHPVFACAVDEDDGSCCSSSSSIAEDSIASEDSLENNEVEVDSQIDLFEPFPPYNGEEERLADFSDKGYSFDEPVLEDNLLSEATPSVPSPAPAPIPTAVAIAPSAGNPDSDESPLEDITTLRSQLLCSIKARKKTRPSPEQLIAKRYEVTLSSGEEPEEGEIISEGEDTMTEKEVHPSVQETLRVSAAPAPSKSSDSSSEGEDHDRQHLVKRISKRRIMTKPVSIEDAVLNISKLPEIDNKTFDKFHSSRGCNKRAKKRASKLKISHLQLLKEELHYDPVDGEWFIAPITSSQMPKQAFSWARMAKAFKNRKTEKVIPVEQLNVEILQRTRQKRLQKFYELAEAKTRAESMKITVTNEENSFGAASSKFIKSFEEAVCMPLPPQVVPTAEKVTLVNKLASKSESKDPNSDHHSQQNKDPCPTKSTLSDTKRPTKHIMIKSPGKSKPGDKVSDGGAQIKEPVDMKLNRNLSTSEDDLDGMREMLLKSMIKKDKLDDRNNSPLPLVNIKCSRNNSPVPSPPPPSQQKDLKPNHSDVNESLMPRKLENLTAKAIQESALITRQIIAKYIVNEDLRLPSRPKDDHLKQKYQRKITPIIAPVVIRIDSESSSENEEAPSITSQRTSVKKIPISLSKKDSPPHAIVKDSLSELSRLLDQLKQKDREMLKLSSERKNIIDSLKYLREVSKDLKADDFEDIPELRTEAKASTVTGPPMREAKKRDEENNVRVTENGLEPGEVLTDVSDAFSDTSSEKDKTEPEETTDEKAHPADTGRLSLFLTNQKDLMKFCLAPKVHTANAHLPMKRNSTIVFKTNKKDFKDMHFKVNTRSYKSPLLIFRSYRFSPYFRTKAKLSLKSKTFTHGIRPDLQLCPHDLHGKCLDNSCIRQHLSVATSVTGSLARTQLCFSAGIKMVQLQKFERDHKNLSDDELTLLFCNYLNSLRKERSKEFYFINTSRIPRIHMYRSTPNLPAGKNRSNRLSGKERLMCYEDNSSMNNTIVYDSKFLEISRYYVVSEVNLTQQCKRNPHSPEQWLLLAESQKSRGKAVVASTLSKALQSNRNSSELWLEYLKVKSSLIGKADLVALYRQALKFAPSPELWRGITPELPTYEERLVAIDAAIELCCNTDMMGYGELLRDKIFLVSISGHDLNPVFDQIFKSPSFSVLSHDDIEWFVRQFIHYTQEGCLATEASSVKVKNLNSAALKDGLDEVLGRVLYTPTLLLFHRLRCEVEEESAAVDYITSVTEANPGLYELLEDVVDRGSWPDTDITWPRLCFLKMRVAAKTSPQLAIEIATKMAEELTGSTIVNVIQTYREMLGISVGVSLKEEYMEFGQGLHRIWMSITYAYLTSLFPCDPIAEFKLYSTKLSYISTSSPQLNALRLAISIEPTTQGVQLLWNRYFEVMEDDAKDSHELVEVYRSELHHCLSTVPTLVSDDWGFHNKVLHRLLAHTRTEEEQVDIMLRYMSSQPRNAPLYTLCIEVSQLCGNEEETRKLAKIALKEQSLSYKVLLAVIKFELKVSPDEESQVHFCKWALNRASALGIKLKQH